MPLAMLGGGGGGNNTRSSGMYRNRVLLLICSNSIWRQKKNPDMITAEHIILKRCKFSEINHKQT